MSSKSSCHDELKSKRYQYVVRSEINGRSKNEDSFCLFSLNPSLQQGPLITLAVADGMGGHAHGEHASREALRKISMVLFEQIAVAPNINSLPREQEIAPEQLTELLKSALEQANHHVRRMVRTNQWGASGSTVALVMILNHTAVVANLGDSPVFHYQAGNGAFTRVTDDHTVAGALLRGGLITPQMARHHEGRSQLEFFIGGPEHFPKEQFVHTLELEADDLLLICSDGVNGSLLEEEMAALLADPGADLEAKADALLKAGVDRGETDNQTLILWQHPKNETAPGIVLPEVEPQGPDKEEAGLAEPAKPPQAEQSGLPDQAGQEDATARAEEGAISGAAESAAEDRLPDGSEDTSSKGEQEGDSQTVDS